MLYRFEGLALNGDTRQLLKGEREIHLSPKAFELLLLLVEQRSRALSKADLQERLWPSTFVGETNLATLVAELRRGLNDSPQDARIIRTIHRFGYRFVAAVEDDGDRRTGARPAAIEMYLATAQQRYPLGEGAVIIGRAPDAEIRLDSGGVSRHHARIVVVGGKATIEDLQSKNGTFLDGRPVLERCRLTDGNEVRIGPVSLTFRISSSMLPTETVGG